MKISGINFDKTKFPNILSLAIWGAPHRRQDLETLQVYRETLVLACEMANIPIPIDDVLDLNILFCDPTTPDLDNLLTAFYRACDSKALSGRSILKDDGLIQKVTMMKFYPGERRNSDNRIP
jgi:Holliday junction resolvase RusA-like endonuclease